MIETNSHLKKSSRSHFTNWQLNKWKSVLSIKSSLPVGLKGLTQIVSKSTALKPMQYVLICSLALEVTRTWAGTGICLLIFKVPLYLLKVSGACSSCSINSATLLLSCAVCIWTCEGHPSHSRAWVQFANLYPYHSCKAQCHYLLLLVNANKTPGLRKQHPEERNNQ